MRSTARRQCARKDKPFRDVYGEVKSFYLIPGSFSTRLAPLTVQPIVSNNPFILSRNSFAVSRADFASSSVTKLSVLYWLACLRSL